MSLRIGCTCMGCLWLNMFGNYFCCCQTFWKVINIPNCVAHEIRQVYTTGQNRQMVNTTTDIESLVDTMTRVTREITYIAYEAANFLTYLHDDVWTRFYRALRKWPVTQQSSVLWTRLFGGLCSNLDNKNILATYHILTTIQWELMKKFELWKLRYSAENASQIPEKDKESSKKQKEGMSWRQMHSMES